MTELLPLKVYPFTFRDGIYQSETLQVVTFHCEPIKHQTKIAADDILIFFFYLLKKIRLDISCESSALQRIHLKHQVLFSRKNNEKMFMNVVCCSHDWRFKG